MNNIIEEWKRIPLYLYWVSNLGRVKSRYKILKPHLTKHGYYVVNLRKDNITTLCYVHILMAEAFIPNPFNLPDVDHEDGNSSNNSISNLRWFTESANIMKSKMFSHNTSGYKGVYLTRNKYRAFITINLKQKHLGYFDNKEDAFQARKLAEEKYWKELKENEFNTRTTESN